MKVLCLLIFVGSALAQISHCPRECRCSDTQAQCRRLPTEKIATLNGNIRILYEFRFSICLEFLFLFLFYVKQDHLQHRFEFIESVDFFTFAKLGTIVCIV